VIEEFLSKNYHDLKYNISIEKEPLGTGGAIQLACRQTSEQNVLVCNGDTFYKVDLHELDKLHQEKKAECTLCLKPMQNFDRYGVVQLNPDNSIKTFKEKNFYRKGLINGGVYALDVERFLKEDLPEKFSFEKDFLEKKVQLSNKANLFGFIQDDYFIDIGIPEDYERAQKELPEL
jgi:D-glycero-alpha-D-manno-heptose 1-phosphate guanylyltransferase